MPAGGWGSPDSSRPPHRAPVRRRQCSGAGGGPCLPFASRPRPANEGRPRRVAPTHSPHPASAQGRLPGPPPCLGPGAPSRGISLLGGGEAQRSLRRPELPGHRSPPPRPRPRFTSCRRGAGGWEAAERGRGGPELGPDSSGGGDSPRGRAHAAPTHRPRRGAAADHARAAGRPLAAASHTFAGDWSERGRQPRPPAPAAPPRPPARGAGGSHHLNGERRTKRGK